MKESPEGKWGPVITILYCQPSWFGSDHPTPSHPNRTKEEVQELRAKIS